MKKKIDALRKMVEKKNATMEYNTCTIKGVKNLSRSDRDSILMYLENIESYGAIQGLAYPYGEVGEVLSNAGIIE